MEDLKEIFLEVLMATAPVTITITVMLLLFLQIPLLTFLQFFSGAIMVFLGLVFFLYGVKTGLLPLGELIGSAIPEKYSLPLVLLIGFILSFTVTLAEPDVRVLALQVEAASEGFMARHILVVAIALGLGIFATLALLRIILGTPMPYLLTVGYLIVFILSFLAPPEFVPISYDAGGVTTGPMAVPFIIALGVGFTAVLGDRQTLADRFGLIGLASIGPVIAVLILGVFWG